MNDPRQHMDEILRDKFSSFEGDIPMGDWAAIESKLNERKRFTWIWWAAVAVILLGLVSVFYYQAKINTSEQATIANTSSEQADNAQADLPANNLNAKGQKDPMNETESQKETTGTTPKAGSARNSKIGDTDPKPLNEPEFNLLEYLKDEQPATKEGNNEYSNPFEQPDLDSKSTPGLFVLSLPQMERVKLLELVKPFKPVHEKFKITYEVGLNLSPAWGLDGIKQNNSKLIHHSYFSSIAGSSSLGAGFNNGAHVQFNFGKRLYLRTGLYGVSYGVDHDFNYTITEGPVTNSKNEIYAYIPKAPEQVTYKGSSSIKYLAFPLQVGNRSSLGRNWGIETRAGMNLTRLLSAKGTTVNPTYLNLESLESNNSIKKWACGVTISTGLFYKPLNNLIFTVEPNFSALIGSARTKEYPIKTKLYNYGINLNLNYVLKAGN